MVEILANNDTVVPVSPSYPGNIRLLGDFLESGGTAKLINKFMVRPAFRLAIPDGVQTRSQILGMIPKLQTAIEQAVNPQILIRDVRCIDKIPMPYREQWARFVGAVRESMYEQFLLNSGRFDSARMVTSDDIAKQILLSKRSSDLVTLSSDGFHFKAFPRKTYGLANAYRATSFDEDQTLLDEVYFFNRKWEGIPRNSAAENRVRLGFRHKGSERVLLQAAARSLGKDADSVVAIDFQKMPIYFVSEASLNAEQRTEAEKLYSGIIKVPLGNPRLLAYIALKSISQAVSNRNGNREV